MGWSSGSRLMSYIIESLDEHVDDMDTKRRIYLDLIEAFEDMDCDTLMECAEDSVEFKVALKEIHPDWFDEDDD